MKRTFSILLIYSAIPVCSHILVSCCGGLGGFDVKNYSVKALGLASLNSSEEPIDTSLFHTFNEYRKSIFVSEKEYAFNLRDHNSTFVTAAIACSPPEPRAKQKFQEIKITTIKELRLSSVDDVIPAGSDITNRFEIDSGAGFSEIFLYLDDPYFIDDYINYMIKLKLPPYQQTRLNLRFDVTLTDGQTFLFEDQTMNVY